MGKFNHISLEGFKSFKKLDLPINSLNVLIGMNGAGKSNLISFFKMLNEMMGGRLQQWIAISGRAPSILHNGPRVTPQMTASLEFEMEAGTNTYDMRLFHAAGETLIFAEERLTFVPHAGRSPAPVELGSGHQETRLRGEAEAGGPSARVFRHFLTNCRVYHFHDSSLTAPMRQYSYVENNRPLMPEADNLAAFLGRLQREGTGSAYLHIVDAVRRIAPFFDDFVLEPSFAGQRDLTLNWRSISTDQIFGPHQLSDGTLRFIALAALLLQPPDELPQVIVIDEPELGLHPAALTMLGGMIRMASCHSQVIVSTQSPLLIDCFEPDDIIVVDWKNGESSAHRLEEGPLLDWLQDYSVGQIWEKNVIGGGPF